MYIFVNRTAKVCDVEYILVYLSCDNNNKYKITQHFSMYTTVKVDL